MKKAGVVGATGYAGAELVRLLSAHPGVKLNMLTSRQYAGSSIAEVYPAFKGVLDLVCQPFELDRLCEAADVIFIALPHKLPMGFVPQLIKQGKKVIDLSADFRLKDAAVYEAHYEPHTAKDLLPEAVYGLAEIYQTEIEKTHLVGNPGCYPTSALLPLMPLLKAGLVDSKHIIIDAKSGVSGAGRSLALTTHFCQVNDSFKAYKIAAHRHTPEIEQELGNAAGQPVQISFVPHLVPMTRGMLTTIYCDLREGTSAAKVKECFESYYKGRYFVRIGSEGQSPDTLNVKGTNFCDIGFKIDTRVNRLILIAAIDNLVKGAAGQAVQNMNIMLGLNETKGLTQTPFPV
jgi:N-acetyl-gamma-glutamyl-phosphate reductase